MSPMVLTSLTPLLLLAVGVAVGSSGPQPPTDSAAAAAAADNFDGPIDPELIDAEATWLRDADTALLAGQLARMLHPSNGFPPDSGPLNLAPLLVFDSAAADNDPYLLAENAAISKRSRYYRRYPWKRQPARGGGSSPVNEYDNPYLCNPTREDVFQLLVALHEARAGNLGRTVSFCNRRRPAASVFTNIRFLGRRRRR